MKRSRWIVGIGVVAVLGGCGASDQASKPAPTPITAPAAKAQGVVEQQNAQLKQMEQQTSQADPTATP